MKSLSTKKIIIAILSVLFAFCMMAGLTANKVSANTNLETVTLKTTMDQSAQMRLTNPTGMRFITVVDEDDVDLFGDDIQVVTMITQKNLLDEKGIRVEDFDKDTDVKMAKVEFNKYNLEDALAVHGSYKLTATILEISDANIAKTYVAKTYITDGEKIGYVGGATEASIYDVATEALKNVNPAEEPENYEVLLGYTKSCTLSAIGAPEGTESLKIPYGSKLSDFLGNPPACYTILIKDVDGNEVAFDSVVTTDLTMEIVSLNHKWVDGKCEYNCGAVCEHPEYDGCTCKTCGQEKAHEYNSTGLCSGCGVAENAINWVEHSTAHAKLTETTFDGFNVLSYKTVTNSAEYNRIKATVTDEFDFIVFDFYILEGCVGQTNETTNSGLRFNWSLSGVSGYLLGDTTYYKDGVIFSNKMTNSTAYYALQVNTWYTAVIDISKKLPEEGQTRTLEFWANALGSWTGEIYLKASRFTNERPMFWRYDVENQKAAASLTYSETISEKTMAYACDGSKSADWADLEMYLTKNGTLSTQFRITEATKTTASTAYKFQIFSNDNRATVVAKCYDESGKEVTMDESGIELNKWYTLVIDVELNEGQTWAYVTWRANGGTTPIIKMDLKNVVFSYPTAA